MKTGEVLFKFEHERNGKMYAAVRGVVGECWGCAFESIPTDLLCGSAPHVCVNDSIVYKPVCRNGVHV